jgi:hypothetical protein
MEDIIEKAKSMNGDLDRALESEGIDGDAVRQAKSQFFNVPERSINFQNFSFEVLKFVPEDAAANYRLVPIGMTSGILEIGMLDPGDVAEEGN